MKRSLVVFAGIFLGTFGLMAQQPGYNYTFIDLMDYVNRHNKIMTFQEPYRDIEGNPFLNDEFLEGEVYTKNKEVLKGLLRYNIYADEMEFLAKDNVYWIDNQENIETIKYGDHLFIYHPKPGDKFDKGDYFEIVEDGPTKLLLKRKVVLMDAVPAKPYQDPKPPRFDKSRDTYYMMQFQGAPEKVTSKSDILKFMADRETEINSFLKKNKISANNLNDLKKVVAYYNGL